MKMYYITFTIKDNNSKNSKSTHLWAEELMDKCNLGKYDQQGDDEYEKEIITTALDGI